MVYKIDFVDFWKGFNKEDNYFINILRKMYGNENVNISDKPDFLFFSCFGFENLRYDCIKIFYTGENVVPDFNLCDYAIGMHEIQFEDRYFRMSNFMWRPEACKKSLSKNCKSDDFYTERKFCCYVISNSLRASQCKEMINLLSSYKMLDSGGKYNNNVGGAVKNKLRFIADYKFNLCFENSSTVGYTTEKIVEGFAGGGIPIYWGNPNIAKDFNEDAFINCHNFDSFEEVLDFVKYLDTDDEAYLRMVHAPVFTENQDDFKTIHSKLESYMMHIFQTREKRINNVYVGKRYIDRMNFFRPWFELYRLGERGCGFLANKINYYFSFCLDMN